MTHAYALCRILERSAFACAQTERGCKQRDRIAMRRAARAALETADRIGADARKLGQMFLRYAGR
jgi:hypothetical protein